MAITVSEGVTVVCVQAEWPMGHRLPRHKGGCQRLHGHNYRLEAEVMYEHGDTQAGGVSDGMVADFAVLKENLREIVAGLDHAMLLQENDPCIEAVTPYAAVVEVPFPPTAEMMAQWIRKLFGQSLPREWRCVRLRLWESDRTWAEDRDE